MLDAGVMSEIAIEALRSFDLARPVQRTP